LAEATALLLLTKGYDLVMAARQSDRLEAAGEIKSRSKRAGSQRCRSHAAGKNYRLTSTLRRDLLLINNAGIYASRIDKEKFFP